MVFNLSINELLKVAKRLGGIEDLKLVVNVRRQHSGGACMYTHVLHDANSLLGLSNKLVLSLLNLLLGLGAELLLLALAGANLEGVALGVRLDGVQRQAGLFDVLSGAGGEHDVGVERRVPAGQEAALNLRVLGQTSLADALHGEGVLLESGGQGVLASASMVLVQGLAASQAGAGNGMAKGLGLGLCGRGRDEGGLGFGGGGGGRQEGDLFADGAAEVLEGLLDVRGVVVGLVGILRATEREGQC